MYIIKTRIYRTFYQRLCNAMTQMYLVPLTPLMGSDAQKCFFFSNEQNVSLRSSRSSFHRCSLQLPVKQSEEESWKLDETRPSKVAATIYLALRVSVTFDALSSTKKKGTSLSVMCGTFLFSSLFVVVFFFLCAHFGK